MPACPEYAVPEVAAVTQTMAHAAMTRGRLIPPFSASNSAIVVVFSQSSALRVTPVREVWVKDKNTTFQAPFRRSSLMEFIQSCLTTVWLFVLFYVFFIMDVWWAIMGAMHCIMCVLRWVGS